MTVLIAGGGIGGLTLALSLHQIGVAAHSLRERARAEAARRRHQRAAACGARADRARPARPARCGRRAHQRAGLLLQARQADLERAARASRPVTNGRNSRSIAARCSRSCSMPRSSGSAATTSSPAIISPAGPRPPTACAPNSSTRRPANRRATHEGALLIAADGIHSAVREKLYPQEGPPIWNGRILWRGVTAGDAFLIRPHHDHGRPRDPEIRLLSDFEGSRTPTANTRSTGSPSGTCRRPINGGARTITAPQSSKSSCPGSRTGNSTGSTCPA